MLWPSRVDAWPESMVGKSLVNWQLSKEATRPCPRRVGRGERRLLPCGSQCGPAVWLPWAAGLGETSLGSHLVPSLSIYQVTGDPGAVLWLEEIRQEVVRANQDTNTAQRSKWAGVGAGMEGRGVGGGEEMWAQWEPPQSPPSPFQPLWGGRPE